MVREGSDVPEPPGGYGVTVVDWLAGQEQPTVHGVAFTVLDLGRRGNLALSWTGDGLVVERLEAGRRDDEALVMDLLFHRVGRDREVVAAGDVGAWFEVRPEEARRWRERWGEAVAEHALRELRRAPRGTLLRRRQARRDRDLLLEAWREWAAAACAARVRERHPDQLADWADAVVLACALGRGAEVAGRVQDALSPSEQAELASGWCPLREGEPLADAVTALLAALPRLPEGG